MSRGWRLEYTGVAPVRKSDKRRIEELIASKLSLVEACIESGERLKVFDLDGRYRLKVDFIWRLGRHHVALYDRDGNWVATVVLEGKLCLTPSDVREALKQLNLDEKSIWAVNMPNSLSVLQFLGDLEKDTDEDARSLRKLLEDMVETGVISLNDGLLDAARKVAEFNKWIRRLDEAARYK